jgi:hypothetical protein
MNRAHTNRRWITGLTVASVAGTGGVAFATMNASTHGSAAKITPQAADTTVTVAPQQYSFQAGAAGQVNLTAAEGELRVDSVLPSAGWSVLSTSGTGTHVELRLGDDTQIITFTADLVDGQVQAGISAAPVPTLPTTPATEPATTPAVTPAPQPAVPVVVLSPATTQPTKAHTSTTSAAGSHEEEGDHDDDEGGSDD